LADVLNQNLWTGID